MEQGSNHWRDVIRGGVGNGSPVLEGFRKKEIFALSDGEMAGTRITTFVRGLAPFIGNCRNNLNPIRRGKIKFIMQAAQTGQLYPQQTNQPDDDELTNP